MRLLQAKCRFEMDNGFIYWYAEVIQWEKTRRQGGVATGSIPVFGTKEEQMFLCNRCAVG